jgi:hypothetical protein
MAATAKKATFHIFQAECGGTMTMITTGMAQIYYKDWGKDSRGLQPRLDADRTPGKTRSRTEVTRTENEN